MSHIMKQFIKYSIVGGSGVVIDMTLLAFTTEIIGVIPWIAVALTQIIVLSYNFTINKLWTFRNKEMPHWQAVRYCSLAGANYLLAVALMYLFNQQLGFNYLLVRIGSIMLMVTWNFLLYKHWVFAEKGTNIPPENRTKDIHIQ